MTALLMLGLGAAMALAMQQSAKQLPLRQYFNSQNTNAVWDWSNPRNKTDKQLDDLADFMYLHQLNAIYIDVSSYASIKQADVSVQQKATEQKTLETAIERYVTHLGKRNIKVYGSAGDKTWSNPEEQRIPLAILDFANIYNKNHPNAKIAGVQFDVESYNQDGFEEGSNTTKSLVLSDYLDMVNSLVKKQAQYNKQTDATFGLGFAIPYWYDNENGNIPAVTWHDHTGPTLYHLLDTLNKLPDTNVVVMAYRNAANGNDGIITHSRTEVDYAQAKAPNVKVMIGQEVTDVEPAKITYYDKSLTELSSQVSIVDDAFKQTGVFGGVAINDLAGFEAMQASE
jgi:hypothetical protein